MDFNMLFVKGVVIFYFAVPIYFGILIVKEMCRIFFGEVSENNIKIHTIFLPIVIVVCAMLVFFLICAVLGNIFKLGV